MAPAATPSPSPPPLYSIFAEPDDDTSAVPSNGRTPLNPQIAQGPSECSSISKVMVGLLLLIAFVWDCVHDFSDTHRTDVQERNLRDRESAVARREQIIQAKEDAMREDEERRKRARLTCYEKRVYHAKLINIPYEEDGQSWCMKTAIDIHGITYDHPEFCTKERQDGAVSIVGHWTVASNEPSWKTWWGNYEKKARLLHITQNGTPCHCNRYLTCQMTLKDSALKHMFNHQPPWDNWAEMCFSTPLEFAGKSFAHSDACDHKGILRVCNAADAWGSDATSAPLITWFGSVVLGQVIVAIGTNLIFAPYESIGVDKQAYCAGFPYLDYHWPGDNTIEQSEG
ncbi:hypothetical protein EDD18DRAFT_1104904 [Armillaria luteobubalina]|uniref:Uncharacterized protein n=1 Tax=Armillaria luteobubalina TaxID=153913 RepID=A0AA39Q7P5_9AGAR|nr:hypothetical protein EDD18DRAFT_1104904 [Armillaria luteobubalina]